MPIIALLSAVAIAAAAPTNRIALALDSSEAEAALSILDAEARREAILDADWKRFLNKEESPPGFSHTGGNEGFRCELFLNPQTGQGVAIMTNSDNGGELIKETERSVAVAYALPGAHFGR